MRKHRVLSSVLSVAGPVTVAILMPMSVPSSQAQTGPAITISPTVPDELNPPYNAGLPPTGGAAAATPGQAAAFAWQEFIALNWTAGPQAGQQNQRDTPSTCHFGDPTCTGPLVWETFRGKVEIFPGTGNAPGYPGVPNDPSLGYDALPQYNYLIPSPVPACSSTQSQDATPWINLDETDQITVDSMYAGVVTVAPSAANSAPKLIRFLAKANRKEYVYVAQNPKSTPPRPDGPWFAGPSDDAIKATKAYIANPEHFASPPPNSGNPDLISLPYGTIEVKAGWRLLNQSEIDSGRFHMATARSYESEKGTTCYVDAPYPPAQGVRSPPIWGLVALHIIQKTPSAPFFVYATFEQADNILTPSGGYVEDQDGNLNHPVPATAKTPPVCLVDPKPAPGDNPNSNVILTSDPTTCQPAPTQTYCGEAQQQLYYQNTKGLTNVPTAGFICVNKRDMDIPQYVIDANSAAHSAMAAYFEQNGIASAPWLFYKLVNVQYYPHDKIPTGAPNGSLYSTNPPYTAQNPASSSFYQANIVVETNRALQLFSGGLAAGGSISDWDTGGTLHKNVYTLGNAYNMGGCMGCHGSQGQNPAGQAGDFSVILARGSVILPEVPASSTPLGAARIQRNRSLK
jgi:hypothetical protein